MIPSIVNQFIYRPDVTTAPEGFTPADLGLDFESITLRTADGLALSAWYLPSPGARHSLLYCHGNGGDIRDWVHAAPPFVEEGISVLLFDYRGYGKSEGVPSEEGLYQDGETAWQWLTARSKEEGIPASILGKSLGSSVAVHSAAQRQPASLVLASAFTSMKDVVTHLMPWIPGCMLPNLYDSLSQIPELQCPTLVIHGERDQLVPLAQSQRLYRALQSPKAMRIVKGAGHNDLDAHYGYQEWTTSFLMNPRGFAAARA
jgi:hypothetical protein